MTLDIAKVLESNTYTLLSQQYFNPDAGVSVPMMVEGRVHVFTSEVRAIGYIENNSIEKVGGVYLIGEINKAQFESAVSGLWKLGAKELVIDADSVDETRYEIENVVSSLGIENTTENSVRLETVAVADYENPTKISEDRSMELQRSIFEGGESYKEIYDNFLNTQTICENVFVMDVLTRGMLPKAKEIGNDDAEYFLAIKKILSNCIYDRLAANDEVFALFTADNNQPVINNGYVYITFTDLYKYSGNYVYVKMEKRAELLDFIFKTRAKGIVVTDGPHYMAVIDLLDVLN